MKRVALWAGLITILALPAFAGSFPSQVSWDGRAIDANGQPLNGRFDMTFGYFTPGGEKLLAETQSGVAVDDGDFHVELGSGGWSPARRSTRCRPPSRRTPRFGSR